MMRHTIENLSFLAGEWSGELGPSTRVEENWSQPSFGSMEARVKLVVDSQASTIELIRIEEVSTETEGQRLHLYVRQFSPVLELRVSEDMVLVSLSETRAVFSNEAGQAIRKLTYETPSDGILTVEVTFPDNQSVLAELKRVN